MYILPVNAERSIDPLETNILSPVDAPAIGATIGVHVAPVSYTHLTLPTNSRV